MSKVSPGDVCFESTGLVMFECPGCECMHGVDQNWWTWNGSKSKPTFFPSILVHGVVPITDDEAQRIMAGEQFNPVPIVCHSYVRDGMIDFLGDCTHKLAGKKVPLEEIK